MAENGIIGLTVNDTTPTAPAAGYAKIWVDSQRVLHVQDSGGILDGFIGYPMQARLTLETGVAVSTADQADKVHVFLTKYMGNKIAVYDGVSKWDILTLGADLDLDVTAFTASKPYDIWVYNNSGTLALDSTVWTDGTTRATALALQDGVYCKTGALTRRYLGTIYMDAASKCQDTIAKRFVWNYYNRVPRKLKVVEATDSWAYTLVQIRQANGATANKVEVIIGLAEDTISMKLIVNAYSLTAGSRYAFIGLDSTTAMASGCITTYANNVGTFVVASTAIYEDYIDIGYHYLAWLESADTGGTVTWQGDAGDPSRQQSGMLGEVMG